MMTNGDPEGRDFSFFLSYSHTNDGFFFLLTSFYFFMFYNKIPDVPEYAKLQFHMMTLLDILGKIAWVG